MSSKRDHPQRAAKREFPERILIADVAHPDRDEVQLEILPEELYWDDLPTATYLRDVGPAS